MDLFDFANGPSSHSQDSEYPESESTAQARPRPLAHVLRPQSLDHVFGNQNVIGPASPFRKWLQQHKVPSILIWGPPGVGKTTIALIIGQELIRQKGADQFIKISAISAGVKDIKEIGEAARRAGRPTTLFVDEIHRFNKSQQDALLPYVEEGFLILIGATTENPSFEINAALLSRLRVLKLDALTRQDLMDVINRGLNELQVQHRPLVLADDAKEYLARLADGDARKSLTLLENLVLSISPGQDSAEDQITEALTAAEVETIIKNSADSILPHDKNSDRHYDLASALIKSMRGSDPNAAVYYLARMLEGGEDPRFIARRLMIFASEDIGNADPKALLIAQAAKDAVLFIGMPEACINLSQAVCYLATAPKDNASYVAINEAIAEVKQSRSLAVPSHLKNPVTPLMKSRGYGSGYQYAHSQPNSKVTHSHLPAELQGKQFYRPKKNRAP